MALVLAETAAGGAALLWLSPLWSEVKRGFFKLTGAVLLVTGASAWGAAAAGRAPGSEAGSWAAWLCAAFAALTLISLVLLFARRLVAARVTGLASVPVSIAALAAMAGTGAGSAVVGFLQLAAGAAFLGAVVDGLLLGHWYLTDRGLTRTPIDRFTTLLWAAVVLEAVAVLSIGFGSTETASQFNTLLGMAGLSSYIAIGMVAMTGLIAVMIRLTLRGGRSSAVQAATGFFYLAVITAFTAEVAARVRFLP